ncbi:hypothetical protein Hanom_Chr04g00341091 [Helianthus anomalus]
MVNGFIPSENKKLVLMRFFMNTSLFLLEITLESHLELQTSLEPTWKDLNLQVLNEKMAMEAGGGVFDRDSRERGRCEELLCWKVYCMKCWKTYNDRVFILAPTFGKKGVVGTHGAATYTCTHIHFIYIYTHTHT